MQEKLYQTTRLKHLKVTILIIITLLLVWWTLVDKVLLVVIPAVLIGYAVGLMDWKYTQRRIDSSNRLILYYSDSIAYSLIVLFLFVSLAPKTAYTGLRLLNDNPVLIPMLVWLIASFTLGYNFALYREVKSTEATRGPIHVRRFYAKSTVGAESMIGKHCVTVRECNPKGTVKVENVIWNAESIDGTSLNPGQTVVIKDIEGLKLLVAPVE